MCKRFSERLIVFLVASFALLALAPAVYAQDDNRLTSPVYTVYNTFIRMQNILELSATSQGTLQATVTLYRQDGSIRFDANW